MAADIIYTAYATFGFSVIDFLDRGRTNILKTRDTLKDNQYQELGKGSRIGGKVSSNNFSLSQHTLQFLLRPCGPHVWLKPIATVKL